MSLALTLLNVGVVPELPAIWLGNYLVAWVIACPASIIIFPVVSRFVARIVEP